jgi:hypothetical protein
MAWAFHRSRRSTAESRKHDVVSTLPLFFVPLVALERDPQVLDVVAFVIAALVMRLLLARNSTWSERLSVAAPVIAGSSFVAMLTMPLRFREFNSVNHHHHEAMHEGWVNSAIHGKWLTADASTAYGPLREYALTAWTALGGVTLEHLRIGLIAMNLVALPVAFAIGWRLSRGRWSLFALYGVAVLLFSPIRFFLDYERMISIGWIDLNRVALALASVVFGVPHLVVNGASSRRAIVGWGALAGACLLYSQEFGLCAIVAATVASVSWAWLSGGAARGTRSVMVRQLTFVGAAALPCLLSLLLYASVGKGTRFATGLFRWVALASAGVGTGVRENPPFPISFADLEGPARLLAETEGARVLAFAAPPLIAVLGGLSLMRAWFAKGLDERLAVRLALVLFTLATFRIPLERPDAWHLTDSGFPAALIAVDLVAALLARAKTPSRARAVMVLLACLVLLGAARDETLGARLSAIASGVEAPSRGGRYPNTRVVRAGDVAVPPEVSEMVEFIQAHVPPEAPILCSIDPMMGPEYYFLSDRRNPTRFDVLAEISTKEDQREILEDLQRDPPVLVLGTYREYFGEETSRFLEERYVPIAKIANIVVLAGRSTDLKARR